MRDFTSSKSQPAPVGYDKTWLLDVPLSTLLIVLVAALLLTTVAISDSFYEGRLANPMTHNDVNYFVDGIQHLALLRSKGLFALVSDFIHGSLHAPLSTYQAMIAYLVFGIEDWAPYVSNIALILVLFGFAAYLLRGCPGAVLVGVLACLMSMPLTSKTVTEFSPEIVSGLFTSIGAVLMVRLSVLDAPLRWRVIAGLFFALGFLAHPSSFPFTFIVVLASVGLAFLRDVVWKWKFEKLGIGITYFLLNVLLSIWLPALYMVPRYEEYRQYFYLAVFDPEWQSIFYNKMPLLHHVAFYILGGGGSYMFGYRVWAYAAIIGAGIFAAWRRSDRQMLRRLAELMVLALVFWLVPTLAPAKAEFYALTFGFTVAVAMIIALLSIYRALRANSGAIVVPVIGVLLLVSYVPSNRVIPNTPLTLIDREFAFNTIDRLKMVLIGNATSYRGQKVYMTNIGAYAPNILQYYLLKTDPMIDWTLDSKWMESAPGAHVEFVRGSRPDFVIAGQHQNGMTYSAAAGPAEDAVFDAMSQDPGYAEIDRFYGPRGRQIAIFARRGNFVGWRPISGMINRSGRTDGPRESPGGLAYLQTFAARAVRVQLQLEWAGAASGQNLSLFVNDQKVGELTFAGGDRSSLIKQEIALAGGTNDIVLRSDGSVTIRRLLIAPAIADTHPSEGISVETATYGGNCGASEGNATWDVAQRCNGKNGCSYPIRVETLGDPVPKCAKDFAVSYSCPSEDTMRHQTAAAEAGFGSVLQLSCD